MSAPRLLVLSQSVDQGDPVLGFFHGWLNAFAGGFPHIHAVCLKEGRHSLPSNIVVHSLGKERGAGRVGYVLHFFRLIWRLRHEYDAVFVHMNPEYVVLGGLPWRLMGKRVYLWRNHWSSGILTDIAVALSHKTFCTSKSSYITKYRKNVLMPVGIDTEVFKISGSPRAKSILSLGRIAPSKNIHVMLDAFRVLKDKGIEFSASIYGDALPKDEAYLAAQKQFVESNGLSARVTFFPGVPNRDTPAIYSSHQIFVNASASGMFDKTMFEAICCGAITLACSKDYGEFAGLAYAFEADDVQSLVARLEQYLAKSQESIQGEALSLRARIEESHSLHALRNRLVQEMSTS